MADRDRELVPANWSLVRERVLTTGQLNAQLDVFSQRPQVCQFESGQWTINEIHVIPYLHVPSPAIDTH